MDKFFEKIARLQLPIKLGVLVGTVVVIAVGYIFLFAGGVSPKAEEEKAERELKAAEKAYTAAVEEKEREKAECKTLKKKLKRARAKMKKLRIAKKLPNKPEISRLIKDFKPILAGVTLVQYSRMPEMNLKRGIRSIPLNLTVRGTFHDVMRFFHKVSLMDRIVNISNVSMGEPQRAAGKVTLKVTFRVNTFRYRARVRRRKKKKKQP